MKQKNIAIFASGSGSNTIKIHHFFKDKSIAKIAIIVSNTNSAGILSNEAVAEIPKLILNRDSFYNEQSLLSELLKYDIDLIVLAGFLWKIPDYLIQFYPNKIINIHPALLPKYGGKGMYGHHVHTAVLQNKEVESGMTIHFVNEHYDDGAIIFQARCDVSNAYTVDEIARRVLILEHLYYPQIIEQVLFGEKPDVDV